MVLGTQQLLCRRAVDTSLARMRVTCVYHVIPTASSEIKVYNIMETSDLWLCMMNVGCFRPADKIVRTGRATQNRWFQWTTANVCLITLYKLVQLIYTCLSKLHVCFIAISVGLYCFIKSVLCLYSQFILLNSQTDNFKLAAHWNLCIFSYWLETVARILCLFVAIGNANIANRLAMATLFLIRVWKNKNIYRKAQLLQANS